MKADKNNYRFYYTDGANWIVKEFSFSDCLNGEPFHELSDQPLLRAYKQKCYVQSTGLLDKSGKEIFEGDIVTDSHNRRMRIEWADNPEYMVQGEYRFIPIINPAENFSTASLGSWWLNGQNKLSVQVIGDIYTTPELLEA